MNANETPPQQSRSISSQIYPDCKVGLSGTEEMRMEEGFVGSGITYRFGGNLGRRISPKKCNDIITAFQNIISKAFADQKDITLLQNRNRPELVKKNGSVEIGAVVFGGPGTVHCEIQIETTEELVNHFEDGSSASGLSYRLNGTLPPRLNRTQCIQLSKDLEEVLEAKMPKVYRVNFHHKNQTTVTPYTPPFSTDSSPNDVSR